jgi:hypothetical protein
MAKPWKTPLPLRLRRIVLWRKERFNRLKRSGDIAKALRAADLYTAASAQSYATLGSKVTGYNDHE